MQWIRCDAKEPFTLYYKETLNKDMPFSAINITPSKKKGRLRLLKNIEQGLLYDQSRPVTIAKKRDMNDLLPFIPPINHEYFRNLETDADGYDPGPLIDYEEDNQDDPDDFDD